MKRLLLIFLVSLAFYTSSFGQILNQNLSYWEGFVISNYGVDEGIYSQQVYDIDSDEQGFIWLVSNRQLLRFDGLSTKNFSKGNEGGTLYQMVDGDDGTKWISSIGNGLYKFEGDSLSTLVSISGELVKTLLNQNDSLYLGTYGDGLKILVKDSIVTTYSTENGLIGDEIWTLEKDDLGQIWIGSNSGLSIFKNGGFVNYTTNNGLPHNKIRAIKPFDNGEVWIGTDNDGIVVFKNNKPDRYLTTENGLPSNIVNDIYPLEDGRVLIATHGGVAIYDHQKMDILTTEHGLISNNVNTLFFDKNGILFIGTEDGLSVLVPKIFQTLSVDGNTPFLEEAVTLNIDGNARLWLGTYGNGYRFLDQNKWNVIENPPQVTNGYAQSGAVDLNGNLWVGTQGAGVFKIEERTFISKLTTKNGLKDDFIRGLAFDFDGNLWVGSNKGISVFDSELNVQETYSDETEIPNPFCITLITTSDGSVWYGSYGGGVVKFNNGEKTYYGVDKGLRSDQVLSIFEDSNKNVWIGTFNYGISKVVGDSLVTYGPESGMPEGLNIAGMLEDDQENLWLATGDGIMRISLSAFKEYDEGKTPSLSYKYYSKEDGLISGNLQAANNSTVVKTNNGTLLFASIDGVSFLDPTMITDRDNSFSPYVDEFLVEETPKNINQEITLFPSEKRLQIKFSAINFFAPNKTQYRVKLSGINKDWEYVGNRTTAYYDYLPDGHYTFTVSAIGPDGMWSDKTASINFTVLPPFYNTWWFRLSIILGFAGLVAFGVQWRNNTKLKSLNRELAYQQKIQHERERISRDLHDNVGSQITNLITGIEISNLHIKNSDKEKAAGILHTLDSEARNTMTDLRETIWLLDKDEVPFSAFIEHLKAYLNRQKQFLGTMQPSISSEIKKELVLNPTQSLNMMRIIQEALNNARKYAEASTFHLHFVQKNSSLILEISDNGKGMNLNESVKIGNGIGNMKERAELISGDITFKSEPNKGTQIKLELPNLP